MEPVGPGAPGTPVPWVALEARGAGLLRPSSAGRRPRASRQNRLQREEGHRRAGRTAYSGKKGGGERAGRTAYGGKKAIGGYRGREAGPRGGFRGVVPPGPHRAPGPPGKRPKTIKMGGWRRRR